MPYIKNNIKAVIFDMDGTVVKTEHLWDQATLDVLAHHGHTEFTPAHEKVFQALSGIGAEAAWKLLKQEFSLPGSVSELIEHSIQNVTKRLNEGVDFVHGFEDFHKELEKREIPTALATNADETSLAQIAQQKNFSQFFKSGINMINSYSSTFKCFGCHGTSYKQNQKAS